MKTIVIANQKGGSGKSTLAVHLAAAAEKASDGPALITDTDPQGSADDWFNQGKRSGIDMPRYAPITLSELSAKVVALAEAGAEYLFIDTAPSVGAVNAELLAAADLVLIPLNPTPVRGWSRAGTERKPRCRRKREGASKQDQENITRALKFEKGCVFGLRG